MILCNLEVLSSILSGGGIWLRILCGLEHRQLGSFFSWSFVVLGPVLMDLVVELRKWVARCRKELRGWT